MATSRQSGRRPETAKVVAVFIELALFVFPVLLGCAGAVSDEALVPLLFAALDEGVDRLELGDAVYKLTSVLVPKTFEPPVAVPRLIVAVEVHMIAYSAQPLAFEEV